MDLYKDAVANELRQMLTAWELQSNNPSTKKEVIDSLRHKINGLCTLLDKIEKAESRNV